MRRSHSPKKRRKCSKLAFLDHTQTDRQWFELYPDHRMLVRQPTPQEVERCKKDIKLTPDVTLVYNLPNGFGPIKEKARVRFFAKYEDTLEQKKQALGYTSVQLYTIAEIIGSHSLPYGMPSLYTRLRSANDSPAARVNSPDDQRVYGFMG